jgi:hypothetical protein
MKSAGDRLIQRIANVKGPVLVLMHPYYELLASKEQAVHIQMLWHARLRGKEPLPDDSANRIQKHYHAVIISDESSFETEAEISELIAKYYVKAELLNALKLIRSQPMRAKSNQGPRG